MFPELIRKVLNTFSLLPACLYQPPLVLRSSCSLLLVVLGRLFWQFARFGFASILQCHVFLDDNFCKSMDKLLVWRDRSRKAIPDIPCLVMKLSLSKCSDMQHLCSTQNPSRRHVGPWLIEAYPLAETVSAWDQVSQVSIQILHLLLYGAQPYWEAMYIFPILTCFFAAEHRLLRNCTLCLHVPSPLEVIVGLGAEMLFASHLTHCLQPPICQGSTPCGQNRWWLKVPSDNTSFSVPKAFVEFTSFPSFHFDCCNLTCFTVWCHIWRNKQIKENQQSSGKPQVAKLEVWVT